jgi:isonocardicin synthase
MCDVLSYYNNDKPLSSEKIEMIENEIYDKYFFTSTNDNILIDVNAICRRGHDIFIDRDYNLPQNIFLMKSYKGKIIVGRKIKSILRIENKINAINCSMIIAPMLLGILKSRIKINKIIEVSYFPFYNTEKETVFNELKKNRMIDIYFPYRYRDFISNKEEVSPSAGWSFNIDRKQYLSYGEVHLRDFTKNYFKSYNFKGKKIYDPACSTGEFLFEFKKHHPNSYTIGHDLSQEMIDQAKYFVDESFCCNAISSPLMNNSVDLLFLRFLNSQILSTAESYKIMRKLLTKVKTGGLIICFGHTPVLISKEWFIKNGIKVLNCNGYDKDRDAIFQYYVMEFLNHDRV